MATPLPPQVTPDAHLSVLLTLTEHYEKAVAHYRRCGLSDETPILKLSVARAEALRWILAETAFPVEENTPT